MIQEKAKSIIKQAVERGVTDLYLQGSLTHYDLYFRNLNSKVFTEELALETGLALIAHFKFCAGMNVGEKRRTQLGACWYQFGTESRRLRLSSVGDFEGNESLVIRFLHEPKEQLEFWFEAEKLFKQMNFRRGLYLFAGPVGSGKTSLMTNWANRAFDSGQVMTVEDPVEIVVSKFVQLQVNDLLNTVFFMSFSPLIVLFFYYLFFIIDLVRLLMSKLMMFCKLLLLLVLILEHLMLQLCFC